MQKRCLLRRIFYSIVKLLLYLLRLFWVFCCIKSIKIMHKNRLSLQTKYIKSTCLTNKTQILRMHLNKQDSKKISEHIWLFRLLENNKMSTFTKLKYVKSISKVINFIKEYFLWYDSWKDIHSYASWMLVFDIQESITYNTLITSCLLQEL